ncbi:SGNH/GDSL hydrolase family protein [uncultured Sphingomonas sp.]|uniref:SGNH/GDSL hydrolase family protein n=1 Tax=uncultured Sphingomonas sp. TaxID=158754 RepID=UPI0025EC5D49|nr:SGNH/GDSL hydrolase family protein [uncultured Sphingomonas sp.]
MSADVIARGLVAQARQSAATDLALTRLRGAMRQARDGAVFAQPPLIAPPAWSASTAYAKGQMVAANGNCYVAVTAGTSASSGAGPAARTVNGGGAIADGGVLWTYFGPVRITVNDAAAPTLTQSATDPAFGITITYKAYPQSFALYGAYGSSFDGANRLIPNGFGAKPGQPGPAAGRRIEFCSDGANVMVSLAGSNAASFCRVAVDQYDGRGLRLVTPGSLLSASPFIRLGWATAEKRRYVVFLSTANYDVFAGVQVDNGATVWAPVVADPLRAVLIADSIVAGSGFGPFLAGNDIATRLALGLGIADIWGFAAGGTGELNPGAAGLSTFVQRLPEAMALKPDLWLILGSCNDRSANGYTGAALSAQVTATMQAIRSGGATAPIIRGGAWPIADSADIAACEAAIKAGYDAFAATDPYPHGYVPVSAATPPIITRGYNNGGGVLMSNVNQYLGGDGHPTDWGIAHAANRLVEGIAGAPGTA